MNFKTLDLEGAYLIQPLEIADERGFFARVWCRDEFSKQGLDDDIQQCSISFNKKKGTLRGMHYQRSPHEETKLVRCTRGAIYDVIVDLRRGSFTRGKWTGVVLTEENRHALYIPKGFAHGFCTLEDDTLVFYQMSSRYVPESAAGFRWNDPFFGIDWPDLDFSISERDRDYPDYTQ